MLLLYIYIYLDRLRLSPLLQTQLEKHSAEMMLCLGFCGSLRTSCRCTASGRWCQCALIELAADGALNFKRLKQRGWDWQGCEHRYLPAHVRHACCILHHLQIGRVSDWRASLSNRFSCGARACFRILAAASAAPLRLEQCAFEGAPDAL